MSEKNHTNTNHTDLDPNLLNSKFKVKTNWHVITGAACSGKTTLIDMLAEKGFKTNPEAGREFFEKEISKGRTIEEIRENRASFTRQIYDVMIMSERGLNTNDEIFLDRGLPDALAFFRVAGMDPNEVLPDLFKHRYASVFLLDQLPYQQDDIRAEEDASATDFELGMFRDYTALGYEVIRVPVLPPEQRRDFVLSTLSA